MASFLADVNFSLPVVEALRALGHDVQRAQEVGLSSTPDPLVLAAATTAGRAVLTFDGDFRKLHNRGAAHAGIVFCTIDPDVAALAARIDAAASGIRPGQLVRVVRPSVP